MDNDTEKQMFNDMNVYEQGFYLMDNYGVKAANYSLDAERFDLDRLDVARAVADGANKGQALLGQAVLQSDKDTFDFAWESSSELTSMIDDLDGVQGNHVAYGPDADTWSAREEIVNAAFEDGNDIDFVHTLNNNGTITSTVEFDWF